MKRTVKFRGILKEVDLSVITPDLIEILIEKGIMYEMKNSSTIREKTKLQFPLAFQGVMYELNRDIVKDIYLLLKEGVEVYSRDILMKSEQIKKATYVELNKKNKLKLLRKFHLECFENIKFISDYDYYLGSYSGFKNFEEFDESNPKDYEDNLFEYLFYLRSCDNTIDYGKHVYMDDQEGWQSTMFSEIEGNNEGLISYFTTKSNHFLPFDEVDESNNIFSICYPSTKLWRSYFYKKVITEYIHVEMNKIKNKKNIIPQKHFSATQKTILFEKILNSKVWCEISVNKKAEILSLLFDIHKDTVRKSLDVVDPNKAITKANFGSDKKTVENALIKLGISLGDPKP